MADAATPHYTLTQPEVGASQNTWGGKLNSNLGDVDELLYNRVVKTRSGKDATVIGDTDVPQEMGLWLKLPAQPHVPVGADSVYFTGNTAATMGWVEYRILNMMDAVFQIGTIIMWSGTVQQYIDIMSPHGWALCDGLTPGTPNFRDRIILASGDYHPPGQFGGSPQAGLGLHTHALTNNISLGVLGSPTFQDDYGGAALYSAASGTNQAYLPFYTACYLMKIRGFSG